MNYSIDRSVRRAATIYTEDGGVASIYHNGELFITEYFQSRLTEISQEEWDYINDGKIYSKEWPHKSCIDEEMIEDALRWLVSSHIKFKEVELENFTINKSLASNEHY